jgi:hypothetical protein
MSSDVIVNGQSNSYIFLRPSLATEVSATNSSLKTQKKTAATITKKEIMLAHLNKFYACNVTFLLGGRDSVDRLHQV